MIEVKARAKLNLFLEITSKRADGYHNLESVFARISLCDSLRLKKGPGIKISVKDNSNLGRLDPRDNLAYKACEAFFREFGITPSVEIELEKNIPVGAGLGGGSSDCAAALRGLARLYSVQVDGRLFKIAERLGSDVPFFLSDLPFARCSGKGEKITRIEVKAGLPQILLVWPDFFVSTKEVYGKFSAAGKAEIGRNLRKMKGFISSLGKEGKKPAFDKVLFNRLEDAVLPCSPPVKKMKETLLAAGLPALMSGSGSAVFALSYSGRELRGISRKISSLHKAIFFAKFV
ncbi:MAG: 4-(cytidine 5'-diphospho)-2-C-methyl-D-erythritol kinase [Elusimicrobia bacterium CG08_land_8_20_14_0_20_51_18]|nr:MAG: 4-(cytidine 5'-diphospho)-2-C-methyl-D-erythritol kinase [Elusimicrobia bacterium CG08_land_8_20_14_0_20_51_18]